MHISSHREVVLSTLTDLKTQIAQRDISLSVYPSRKALIEAIMALYTLRLGIYITKSTLTFSEHSSKGLLLAITKL